MRILKQYAFILLTLFVFAVESLALNWYKIDPPMFVVTEKLDRMLENTDNKEIEEYLVAIYQWQDYVMVRDRADSWYHWLPWGLLILIPFLNIKVDGWDIAILIACFSTSVITTGDWYWNWNLRPTWGDWIWHFTIVNILLVFKTYKVFKKNGES